MKAPDFVDRTIEQWRVERPDLDPSGKAVTARIVRANAIVERRLAVAFAPSGLKQGDYSAVAALRRGGEPYELPPARLAEQLMVTTGGMTLMLDRLERRGLVRRRPNPDDRRGVIVGLTAEGRRIADEAMTAHAAAEQDLVAGLTERQRDQLASLLAAFLRANDSD